MLLAAQFAQTNRSDDFFGMERKIAVHHPRIVARLDPKHLGYRASLVLTETEHFHAFVVIDDTASKIDILRPGRELGQEIDIVLQLFVALQLRKQHFISSQRIGFGRMRLCEVLTAIELVGSHERALLHAMEDILYVDKTAFVQIDIHARAEKLLDQHRDIELIGVIAPEIASLDITPQ